MNGKEGIERELARVARAESSVAGEDSQRTAKAEWMRVSEVCTLFGISRSYGYKLVQNGYFETVRLGRSVRISRRSVEEFLERNVL
ncbi:MAG: DNA-binding protein [Desulfobacteraceae bacterium]|nr:MAG: DNA-binding protein [Desulfobacteraceae bacterium]